MRYSNRYLHLEDWSVVVIVFGSVVVVRYLITDAGNRVRGL